MNERTEKNKNKKIRHASSRKGRCKQLCMRKGNLWTKKAPIGKGDNIMWHVCRRLEINRP